MTTATFLPVFFTGFLKWTFSKFAPHQSASWNKVNIQQTLKESPPPKFKRPRHVDVDPQQGVDTRFAESIIYIFGMRRNVSTVEQRIYNLVREEELVSKIPYPGCIGSAKMGRYVARADWSRPSSWQETTRKCGTISFIYKDEDQASAASQRRRSKLKIATGSWDDIRWWQHDNKRSNWWDVWRRTYASVTQIIGNSRKTMKCRAQTDVSIPIPSTCGTTGWTNGVGMR